MKKSSISMVVQRLDKFSSWPVVTMWQDEFEDRDFHEPVENFDGETDKEIQRKLLDLEWSDDLAYDSVASELRKGVGVQNAKTNEFSAWFPERCTSTDKPRRTDKTSREKTLQNQKDFSHNGHSNKLKEIVYMFRHYVNTALYIEQYRQEHTYSGMLCRQNVRGHRALSDSVLNRIQQRSQRLRPETELYSQPPPHIRFHTQSSSGTPEFIELARQYKVASDMLRRPDDVACLSGVDLMRLDRPPGLMCSRPASDSSNHKSDIVFKSRGLQTVNLNIPAKVPPKSRSHKSRLESASENGTYCFSGKPMKPFPANGHCNMEELASV